MRNAKQKREAKTRSEKCEAKNRLREFFNRKILTYCSGRRRVKNIPPLKKKISPPLKRKFFTRYKKKYPPPLQEKMGVL